MGKKNLQFNVTNGPNPETIKKKKTTNLKKMGKIPNEFTKINMVLYKKRINTAGLTAIVRKVAYKIGIVSVNLTFREFLPLTGRNGSLCLNCTATWLMLNTCFPPVSLEC